MKIDSKYDVLISSTKGVIDDVKYFCGLNRNSFEYDHIKYKLSNWILEIKTHSDRIENIAVKERAHDILNEFQQALENRTEENLKSLPIRLIELFSSAPIIENLNPNL